jgi:hypothetical protein
MNRLLQRAKRTSNQMCEFGQFTTAVCTLETDSLQQSTATIICLPRDRYHVDDSQVANTNIELALSERTQSPSPWVPDLSAETAREPGTEKYAIGPQNQESLPGGRSGESADGSLLLRRKNPPAAVGGLRRRGTVYQNGTELYSKGEWSGPHIHRSLARVRPLLPCWAGPVKGFSVVFFSTVLFLNKFQDLKMYGF